MSRPGLNSDDFLRLSEEVWPIRKNHPFMASKGDCPSVADLTHFGALVERAAKPKPLPERAILDLVPTTMPIANDFDLLWFARAIERAHGIQEGDA